MSWLSDLIKKGKNVVDDITSGVNNVVQNISSGYQDWIEGREQKNTQAPAQTPAPIQTTATAQTPAPVQTSTNPQTTTPSTAPTTSTPSVTAPVTTPPTSTPQTSTPTTTNPTTTPETTPPESTPPTSTPEVATGFDSYEDYLGNNLQNAGNIYTNTTTTLDKQNKETLQQIDETLEKGKEYATDVKETTDKALEGQKTEVYKYIEDTLADTLGYNNEAYGKLVEDITGAMEAGKLRAEEAKNLLMLIADEAKNATYGAAERQREEAERQADINRQRAITDANSAYEQNKAGYGANAEALGNMGLSGGGYSDWINASAYAQNRSEVQGARAQSDAAKREAKYTEDMTKLQADRDYTDKKYQAESDYLYKLGEIDTTYRTNMTEAEQKKLKADQDAKDTARDLKHQADSDYAAGKLKSETEYKGFLYDIESEADKNRLETNQQTELGKLEASNNYITAIMKNEGELAKFKEDLKAGDEKAKQVQLSMYEKVLKGVSDGTYTADDAAALANAFEFSQEWKNAIANAANKREEDVTEAEKSTSAENIIGLKIDGLLNSNTSDKEIQDFVDAGLISKDDLEKVTEERNYMAKTEVEELVKGRNYDGAINKVEDLLDKGIISEEDDIYQNTYFEASKASVPVKDDPKNNLNYVDEINQYEADIKNLLDAGKISQADYDSLISYMYQNIGGTLNKGTYTIGSLIEKDWLGRKTQYPSINIGNNQYKLSFRSRCSDGVVCDILNGIAGGNPSTDDLIMFDGYLYKFNGDGWLIVADENGLYDAYNKQLGYQAKPTAPKHQSDNKKTESNSTTGSGAGTNKGVGNEYVVHTNHTKNNGVVNKNIVQTNK